MRTGIRLSCGGLLAAAISLAIAACGPSGGEDETRAGQGLRVHPDNHRYLLFRGRPTVLITSGEHYGAVVNADFDFVPYLDELARHGLNQTRLFSGSYVEPGVPPSKGSPSAVALRYENTLAPRPGRYVSPWARVGGRFDLSKWNPAYFERLKEFVREAGERDIVVELVLFSALYVYASWRASPFHADNNVNGVGGIETSQLYTLDNGRVLEFQEAFVRKLVAELRSFDNLYYEVINEGHGRPAPASDAWQDHIIQTIEDAESEFPEKHLIARGFRYGDRVAPDPAVSIHNFHYERDLSRYAHLDGVLAFDETGLKGRDDEPYRTDGWYFMLSGGGIYSNLDYSFTPTHEDGSFEVPDIAAGGGGVSLRRSLGELKRFLERFDLPRMFPAHEIVIGTPPGATARVLAEPGEAYAVYLLGGRPGPLVLDLAPGRYAAEWVDPRNGRVLKTERVEGGVATTLRAPRYTRDIALAIEAGE